MEEHGLREDEEITEELVEEIISCAKDAVDEYNVLKMSARARIFNRRKKV